jgi:hypothetical protein
MLDPTDNSAKEERSKLLGDNEEIQTVDEKKG